ncbi:hypothetical protein MTO96_045470, partial [Rhipicephalus appendiculatus]
PYGKLAWENNWVTFLDSMLQFWIFVDPSRTFQLPVAIQSCAIDTKVHAQVVTFVSKEGLDVTYDGYQKTCRAGGVVVKGLKNHFSSKAFYTTDATTRRVPLRAIH